MVPFVSQLGHVHALYHIVPADVSNKRLLCHCSLGISSSLISGLLFLSLA